MGGSSTSHVVYMYEVKVNGVRYRDQVSRILAQYAINELFVLQREIRQVHHIDGNHSNWRPSNLVLVENRKQHVQADLYARAQKLTGKPITVRLKNAVYLGDIIRDDDFDIEVALEWWREQVCAS